MSKIFAIANQKGGVGKTTTSVNLATALSAVGKNVLLVDLDPQGNASTGLGVKRADISYSAYDLLFNECSVEQAARTTRVPRLSVIPSSIHLSGAEIELVDIERREYCLADLFKGNADYDYIIFDCPPSLSLLTLNALSAADGVIVPLQCEFYALEGLSHLVKTIEKVKAHYNSDLELEGIVLTMYDQRNRLSAQVEDDVRSYFGETVYQTVIPRNVRVSEAPSYGLPAIVYDMNCAGSSAYILLAKEILNKEKAQNTAQQEAKHG